LDTCRLWFMDSHNSHSHHLLHHISLAHVTCKAYLTSHKDHEPKIEIAWWKRHHNVNYNRSLLLIVIHSHKDKCNQSCVRPNWLNKDHDPEVEIAWWKGHHNVNCNASLLLIVIHSPKDKCNQCVCFTHDFMSPNKQLETLKKWNSRHLKIPK
jgi:hypothetical protein